MESGKYANKAATAFVEETLIVSTTWKVLCDIFYNVESKILIFHIVEITM